MVRLIPVNERGKIVWVEDAPDACANGHEVFPNWGPCPNGCRKMMRVWYCREDGCGAPVLYDDEHECPAGTLRA